MKNAIVPRISTMSIDPSFTRRCGSVHAHDHAQDQQVLSGCQTDHAGLDFTIAKEAATGSRRIVIAVLEAYERLRLPERRTIFERARERLDRLVDAGPPAAAIPAEFGPDRGAQRS